MTGKLTRERLQEIAEDGFLKHGESKELARMALAAMDSEPDLNPVLAYADSYRDMAKQGVESVPIWSVITDLERNIAPLYRHAQPVPEKYNIGDATMRHIFTPTGMTDVSDMQAVFDRVEAVLGVVEQPALAGVDDDVRNVIGLLGNNEWVDHCTSTELGHRLESEITRLYNWRSAQQAQAVPDDVLEALRKVALIRLDLNNFDGDHRGLAFCLSDAEETLIEVVNRRATMLAAAPQEEKP